MDTLLRRVVLGKPILSSRSKKNSFPSTSSFSIVLQPQIASKFISIEKVFSAGLRKQSITISSSSLGFFRQCLRLAHSAAGGNHGHGEKGHGHVDKGHGHSASHDHDHGHGHKAAGHEGAHHDSHGAEDHHDPDVFHDGLVKSVKYIWNHPEKEADGILWGDNPMYKRIVPPSDQREMSTMWTFLFIFIPMVVVVVLAKSNFYGNMLENPYDMKADLVYKVALLMEKEAANPEKLFADNIAIGRGEISDPFEEETNAHFPKHEVHQEKSAKH